MADHVHLITEQDIHAYVDGELTEDRRRAVEAFLADRGVSAEAAVYYLRQQFDLRSARAGIYAADPALKGEIDTLLARRREGRTPRPAASFRAAAAGRPLALVR
jgi:anti-sigma factor RsiW